MRSAPSFGFLSLKTLSFNKKESQTRRSALRTHHFSLSSIQKSPLSKSANLEFEPPFAKKLLSGRPETGQNQAIQHGFRKHPVHPFFLILLDFVT
jgi:hypothetical protein